MSGHSQKTQQHQQLDIHGGLQLFLFFVVFFSLCPSASILTARRSSSSGCCPVKAAAKGGQGKGGVPFSQEGGREEQPVSKDFLHSEKCWLGIEKEKVYRELLAILSFSCCS